MDENEFCSPFGSCKGRDCLEKRLKEVPGCDKRHNSFSRCLIWFPNAWVLTRLSSRPLEKKSINGNIESRLSLRLPSPVNLRFCKTTSDQAPSMHKGRNTVLVEKMISNKSGISSIKFDSGTPCHKRPRKSTGNEVHNRSFVCDWIL